MMEALDIFASAGLWAAVLRIATPLIFGTLGALICERSGVLNLGIEGIMTFGAMIGWMTVYHGGGLWAGIAVAALSGAMFGLLHAAMTVPLGLSQHVTGLGITLFASSLSYYIFRLSIPVSGSPPTIVPFQPIAIPGLSALPTPGAFYVFADCSGLFGRKTPEDAVLSSDLDVAGYLLESAHVGMVHGSAFGMPGHLRIAYAIDDGRLAEALSRVAAALDRLV